MKKKLPAFAQRYLAGLDRHLQDGTKVNLAAARSLGTRAMDLGLETLEMARIHEEALITLVLPRCTARSSKGMVRRAGAFFAEAITPLEETHRGAREANVQLKGVIEALHQRTGELAALNEELNHEIVQRKAVEDSLRTSELTTSQLLKKSRQMQEDLRNLSRRLLSAQEDERKKISRELHDVIAQTLTGINMRLASLKSQTTANTQDLHKKIAVTQRLVEKSVDLVHRFARDLRPAVLDDLGLIPALQSYLKDFMEQTGVRVKFSAFAGVEKLDGAVRTVLYRVAQEALTNVARHARASHARVSITEKKDDVCMDIHDDGRGFQVERAVGVKSSKRLGLLGMRERVEMVGGTFCVESAPGRSTTIRVELPREQAGAKKPRAKTSGAKNTLKCP